MRIKHYILLISIVFTNWISAQNHVLVGYWQNWQEPTFPYIELDQVDDRYNVICVSFALPTSSTDMTMLFAPDQVSVGTLQTQIQTLRGQGKKVLLSIGGAGVSISLNNGTNTLAFTNSIMALLDLYNFDGIDIDFEGGNTIMASGTVATPTSPDCLNFIDAIHTLQSSYLGVFGVPMMLTFAPETAGVQGGMSSYSGMMGGYLPILNALRADIDYIHVQLYNTGSMYALDGVTEYFEGTPDFIIAMTEAMIQGFTAVGAGGYFAGFDPSQVVVGLPACPAASSGFVSTTDVQAAVNYLIGAGPKPGLYTLVQAGGYPTLGGLMTWSINCDKVNTCNAASYEYAQNFETIFGLQGLINSISLNDGVLQVFPNPSEGKCEIKISDFSSVFSYEIRNPAGKLVQSGNSESIDISSEKAGIYVLTITSEDSVKSIKLVKE